MCVCVCVCVCTFALVALWVKDTYLIKALNQLSLAAAGVIIDLGYVFGLYARDIVLKLLQDVVTYVQ